MSLEIGGLVFANQNLAKNHVRSILKSIGDGGYIDKTNPFFNFFLDLVMRHPKHEEKIGKGVNRFLVYSDWANENCFGFDIERIDLTKENISFNQCVTGHNKSEKNVVIGVFRHVINDDIVGFKNLNFKPGMQCPLCGCILNKKFDAHVDHILPFKDILASFLKKEPNTPKVFDIDPSTKQKCFRMEDAFYAVNWIYYHRSLATYRILCSTCNVSRRID